jgi:hypothetical protein
VIQKLFLLVIVDQEAQFPALRVIPLVFLAFPIADFQDLAIHLYVFNPSSLLVFPIHESLSIY